MKLRLALPLFALSPLLAGETPLSKLDLSLVSQGWGAARAAASVAGAPLRVAGRVHKDGVGTHADSELAVTLSPGANRFVGGVGVDDDTRGKGSVEFRVLAGEKVLWSSGVMRGGDAPKSVDIDLAGHREISLCVTDAGDGIEHDHADWLDARFIHSGAAPVAKRAGAAEPGRLTPPESPAPRINGAKVFGVRPGSPLFFQLAVSGERPMRFAAEGLPAGATLDPTTGRIVGKLDARGEFPVKVTATNAKGSATGTLRLVVGDRIALTPPMGWNSWYCFSEAVSQKDVADMARAMRDTGMVNYGWSYVNIDDCWNAAKRDASGAMAPNERFPDMPGLVSEIHGYGLRAGIYSTPWMASYAGFIGGSLPNAQADFGAKELPPAKRAQPGQFIGTYPAVHKLGLDKVGPDWRFDRDMRRYAEWGFDYIKVDWHPLDIPTLKRVADAVRSCGRDIVLSLSNHADLKLAGEYGKYAELWRTSGDIRDSWGSVSSIGFDQNSKWAAFSRPGNWNDPDMLQVGYVGEAGTMGKGRHTRLTPNEQYAQVSLWALSSAPLILSCDLRKLDDFTLGLLMNPEVIDIDQDAAGAASAPVELGARGVALLKPLADGSYALGLFNRGEKAATVSVSLTQLGLAGKFAVRDLWRCADEGFTDSSVSAKVGRHGVKLVKLTPVK